jgi:hypothetical protein
MILARVLAGFFARIPCLPLPAATQPSNDQPLSIFTRKAGRINRAKKCATLCMWRKYPR